MRRYEILVLVLVSCFYSTRSFSLPVSDRKTYYPIGKSFILPYHAEPWMILSSNQEKLGGPSFSPDGQKVALLSQNHQLSFLDTKTGEVQDAKMDDEVDEVIEAQFISNDEVCVVLHNGEIKLLNLRSSKLTNLGQFPWKNSEDIVVSPLTPDGKTVIGVDASHMEMQGNGYVDLSIFNLDTKKIFSFREKGLPFYSALSPDGQKLFLDMVDVSDLETGIPKVNVFVMDLKTFKKAELKMDMGWILVSAFSSDSKKMAMGYISSSGEGGSKVIIFDSKLNVETELLVNGDTMINSLEWSKDNRQLLYASGQEVVLYDLSTQEKRTIAAKDKDPNMEVQHATWFDGDQKILITEGWDLRVHDLKDSSDRVIKVQQAGYPLFDWMRVSADGQKIGLFFMGGHVAVLDVKTGEVERVIEHSDDLTIGNFSKDGKWVVTVSGAHSLRLTPVSVAIDSDVSLSDGEAKQFLNDFKDYMEMDFDRDVPKLHAAFSKDLKLYTPDIVADSLLKILNYSDDLFEAFVNAFPLLLSSSDTLSDEIFQKKRGLIDGYLNFLKFENPPKTQLSQWESLKFFKPYLGHLDSESKELWIDYVAQSLADHAADTSDFQGIFLSKLYKFTRAALEPLFNDHAKRLTDLTLVREAQQVTPVILGSAPIDGDEATKTPYGFYDRKMSVILVPEQTPHQGQILSDEEFKWIQRDETFRAHLNVTVGDQKAMIPEGKSPNYKELWKDEKLVGMVITGSNLKSDAKDVLSEYFHYYRRMGFKFNERVLEVGDLPSFLKEKITSGELDYFIKEAHSDGDERNLFRMDKVARVSVGERVDKNRVQEVIYLVYPLDKSSETILLENSLFGQWIRDREKNHGGQFVYFNSSCWSVTKAVHEIEAASSILFLNIPTITTANAFADDREDTECQMFTAFRFKKSYEEMRKWMEKNHDYKERTDDVFIFPDEDEYKDQISKVIATPLVNQISILDGQGQPYNIDERQ